MYRNDLYANPPPSWFRASYHYHYSVVDFLSSRWPTSLRSCSVSYDENRHHLTLLREVLFFALFRRRRRRRRRPNRIPDLMFILELSNVIMLYDDRIICNQIGKCLSTRERTGSTKRRRDHGTR